VIADNRGHIGWTIAGRLPERGDARGRSPGGIPQLSTDPAVGFAGWLSPQSQPQVIDPPGGILWSANARVVGGPAASLIGDDGMDRGARAAQILADLKNAPRPFTPRGSLAVQLDDRALFLERWRYLLREVIDRARAQGNHAHDAAHVVLETWSGHAAPTDAAYRLVQVFRAQVEARAFFMLVAPARQQAPDFRFQIPASFEGPLWRLLQQRPLNLLATDYADWDALLLEALVASEALPSMCHELSSCTWGEVNAVHVAHSLSAAVPLLSRFLDMSPVRVAGGHQDMPRIQGPDYGASERFSVSPGHEDEGYFHMPGGQSGHPLSPFYRAGFAAWAEGRPTPFLPGPAAHSFALIP
jgi:penicillin G amidase